MTTAFEAVRSPICWLGGKSRMARRIIPLFPRHVTYVEPFGGGGAVLFAKPPSAVEVYNDLDGGLVNFFRVLRDRRKFRVLQLLASLTPYSREEYDRFRRTWEKARSEVQRAYEWLVVARMSFGGIFDQSWGSVVTSSNRGMAQTASAWLSTIERLPEAHARLIRVQVEHQDFRTVLDRYDRPETLFYVDPPYVSEVRRGGGYRCELTVEDHQALTAILLGLQGKAILSGYRHEVHRPLEKAGWKRLDFKVVCTAAGATRGSGLQGLGSRKAKQRRVESLWISPRAQADRKERGPVLT